MRWAVVRFASGLISATIYDLFLENRHEVDAGELAQSWDDK